MFFKHPFSSSFKKKKNDAGAVLHGFFIPHTTENVFPFSALDRTCILSNLFIAVTLATWLFGGFIYSPVSYGNQLFMQNN